MKAVLKIVTLQVVMLAAFGWAQQRSPVIEQIAKEYGIDSFGQIEAIRYTFNLDVPGLKLSRSWEWEPKTGKVTYNGKDKEGKAVNVTYMRGDLSKESDLVKKEVEPGFVNDNYWLLFPFHAYWDTGATVTDKGMQKLKTGTGSARLVEVKYPSDVGYTPGDTWDLYVGKDNRVEQLVFRHGGTAKPGVVIASWTGYKKAGPLLISTEHRGTADGKPLHLWISNVAVKLAGSDKWVDAQ